MSDDVDIVEKLECEGQMLMLDKSVGTESIKTVDKCIGNNVVRKSVRTQYNSLHTSKVETVSQSPQQLLKVKISVPKVRDKCVNTEFSFPPNTNIKFYSDTEGDGDEIKETETEVETETDDVEKSDSTYIPEYTESSDDSSDPEESCFDYTNTTPVREPKFLVFWTCLMSLFRFCFTCFQKTTITCVKTRGTLMTVTMTCPKKHVHKWQSQPIINGMGAGNLLLSASILYSGNTFTRISEMLSSINVVAFSRTLYYQIQKTFLYPTLNTVYKLHRANIFNVCRTRTENNFIGDGRSDSPGYSAKYGTYSLMSTDINKIVDFHVVHVGIAGNSSRMEKKGLEILLEKLQKFDLKIASLTTDRHVQIRAFLKKDYPELHHQFDVWHFGKSIKKALSSLAKRKDCQPLGLWIKAVVNHLWWCCATCEGDEHLLKEKWLSILYHIRGIHSWEGNEIFHECQHPELSQQRKWLTHTSPAFLAVKGVVENKRTLGDLKYLVKFCHTGNLEVFHSVINKYCPKRLHFSIQGMIARTQLAVLDFNSGIDNQQATTKDGTLRFKQSFSRVTQNWVIKKITEKKERQYLDELMTAVVDEPPDHFGTKLPQVGDIQPNIAPVEKPNKEEAIRNMRTRFET